MKALKAKTGLEATVRPLFAFVFDADCTGLRLIFQDRLIFQHLINARQRPHQAVLCSGFCAVPM